MAVFFVNRVNNRSRQRGATLVELMISVFVFAIGVLGYSALQTRSIQATSDNSQRGDVVTIADGLIARISSNIAAGGQYALLLNGAYVCPAAAPAICAETAGGVPGAGCNAAATATFDVWDEMCNNPNGGMSAVQALRVTLTCDGAGCGNAGVNYTLDSLWCARSIERDDDIVAGAGATPCVNQFAEQSYTLVFRP